MLRRVPAIVCSLWLAGPALAQNIPGSGGPMLPVLGPASPSGSLTSTPARAVNVTDPAYGATGNTKTISSACSIAAASNALNCPGAPFVAVDVGKYILIHGAGAAGAALQTTIATFVDASNVTLATTATQAVPQSAILSAVASTSQSGAGSYAPNDTIVLAGGTATTTASLTVNSTQVASAVAGTNGTGCTDGTYNVTGTTGRATRFQASVTMATNVPTVNSVSVAGSYFTNPTTLTSEPVTGVAGCTVQPTLSVSMGVLTWFYTGAGLFSGALPGSLTQASTSGVGTGAIFTPTFQANGTNTVYGNDDTAAVAAAVAAASGKNSCVYFPPGAFWLASSASSISLTNNCLRGDNAREYSQPYTNSGSTLLISNATTPQFIVNNQVNFSNLVVFYPAQDGSVSTPVAFPALFEAGTTATGTAVNDVFSDNVFINPYTLWYQASGDRAGRIFFKSNKAYCVQYCFNILNGMSDILAIDGQSIFSVGVFPTGNYAPGNYLVSYTAQSGEFLHLDTTSGSYKSLDGLVMTGPFIYGYGYGLRLVGTGTMLDVSTLTGVAWDNTLSFMSVEGSACVISTNFSGGWTYSTNVFSTLNAHPNAFNWATSCPSTSLMFFSGFNVNYALGNAFSVNGVGPLYLSISGGVNYAWGQTTFVGGSGIYSLLNTASYFSHVDLSGVTAVSVGITAHANDGVQIQAGGTIHVGGSHFSGAYQVAAVSGTAGTTVFEGNISEISTFSGPVNNITGTGALYDMPSNLWDKPALPTLTSGWGTGPALAAWSTNNKGSVTVGTTPTTSLLLTYGTGAGSTGSGVQPHAGICQATDITTHVSLPVSASTTTAVTFFGTVAAGDVVQYQCSF